MSSDPIGSNASPAQVSFPSNHKTRYADGMEKPPFQFRLKAVFAAMSVVAMLSALPTDVVVAYALMAFLGLILVSIGLAFLITLSLPLYYGSRLWDWLAKRRRPGDT
jgi:hypothetical protein